MELDLNRFRTLIPLDSLSEDRIELMARQAQVDRHARGTTLFTLGDHDNDSLFLMLGEVVLEAEDGTRETILAGTGKGLYALAHLKPRRYTCKVTSEHAVFVRLEADMLDRMLTIIPGDTMDGMEVNEFDGGHNALDSEWMMSMLQSPTFLKLPASNIQALFERMEEIACKAGDVIIRQGEPGDFYYIIKAGTASVTRHSGASEARLATLNPPRSFGEEALLSDEPRNASVTMETDGTLMRLSKDDFQSLMQEPLLDWVSLEQAGKMVREGATRVDVRTEAEFEESGVKCALNLPMYLLRLRLPKLDRKKRYILYCDTGTRSAAAGFIMSQQGYDVYVLKGGLAGNTPQSAA